MTISVTFKAAISEAEAKRIHQGYKGRLEIHNEGEIIDGRQVIALECFDPDFYYWAQNYHGDIGEAHEIVLVCPHCNHEWFGDASYCPDCEFEFEDE